jgi:chorismate synthase
MLRFTTAGESHGPALIAIIEGIPAGLPLAEDDINRELLRRQKGYGRGERMQRIERDSVKILSGVRWGETTSSPITIMIENKDWANWVKIMSIYEADEDEEFYLLKPRPGHGDLAGVIKYNRRDVRDILERASARETAARVAVGAVCKKMLSALGIRIISYVESIGDKSIFGLGVKELNYRDEKFYEEVENSLLRCPCKEAEQEMINLIDEARNSGDTLGGVFCVIACNVPIGLGSHTQWDLRLDGKIAQAIISIPGIKGVEIGGGFSLAYKRGSAVHDEIFYSRERGFYRKTNNAGGIEAGISNGEDIVVRAAMKPISSLKQPLSSVNIKTKETTKAEIIRSDVCAVPAASVIGEAMLAIVLTSEILYKFGGDSMEELKRNYKSYVEQIKNF